MAELASLLRDLAAAEPEGLPVVSAYLDMRLHATGENPNLRSGEVVLADRLREIEKSFGPRGPELDSVRADIAQIEDFLHREFARDAYGLAIFACAGHDIFEVIETSVPFDNQVTVSDRFDLFPLAQLLCDLETGVVALIDTNTARFFVARRGWFEEVNGLDDDPKFYGTRRQGNTNFRAFTYERRERFARETAAAVVRLVERTGAAHVFIAGNEVSLPYLHGALPTSVASLLRDQVLRLNIRTPAHEVGEQILPLLVAAETERDMVLADQLVRATGAGDGVVGLDATRAALERGQVSTLVLDPSAEVEAAARSELVRLALQTSAEVIVVGGHEPFRELSGIGGLLRYRLDPSSMAPGE